MSKALFARWVSIVGHPFLLTPLFVLIPIWGQNAASALRNAGVVAAVVVVPLGILIWQRRRTGRWKTVDASERSERPILYRSIFVVLPLLAAYYRFVAPSPIGFQRSMAILLMVGVASALNPWIKLSLHLAFAGFFGLALAGIHLAYGLPILLLIPFLAWSRLELSRHTKLEVIGGLALGLVAACILLYFWPQGA
jgi:hypothetical protein